MATVRIGDRDLDVKVATLGMLKKKLIPARKAIAEASLDETPDRLAELAHCYVGEPVNQGVTVEWLLDNLPADPVAVLREIVVASGQKVTESKPGEEARQ